MAIKFVQTKALNCLELISEIDDAVDQDKSFWEKYTEDYDQKHLTFVPDQQPTKFILNFDLTGKQMARVKNSMIGARDEEEGVKIALGDWAFRIVKYTLKDIKNPEGIPESEQVAYRKDKDGYTHDEVLVKLDRLGIVQEIFNAYNTLISRSARGNAKN